MQRLIFTTLALGATASLGAGTAFAQSAAGDPRVTLASPTARAPSAPLTIIDGVAASVAATVIAVPTSIGLANAMTHLSPDLLGGGIPALLWLGFAPPFAAHGLAVLAMNLHEPGRYNLWPTIFATVPLHWGALAVGALSGVWLKNVGNLALFTLVESILLPAVSVTLSWATRRPPQAPRARARAPMPSVAEDSAPLFRATQVERAHAYTNATSTALSFPVFSGRF